QTVPLARFQFRGRSIRTHRGFLCSFHDTCSSDPLLRQRIGPHLDVYGARLGALTALLQPWRAVAVRAPQAATFPAGARIVDTAIQALGKKAQRYGMRSMTIRPSLSATKPSLRLAVEIGMFSPRPTVLCWSTQV